MQRMRGVLRVQQIKRMVKGGAAGYVAKYIAKSVGHLALAEHQDVVNGHQITLEFGDTNPRDAKEPGGGFKSVDAWAATWTGFNNCTARITGELIRELVPPSAHFKEDWCTPETVAQFRALRAMQATEAWH